MNFSIKKFLKFLDSTALWASVSENLKFREKIVILEMKICNLAKPKDRYKPALSLFLPSGRSRFFSACLLNIWADLAILRIPLFPSA